MAVVTIGTMAAPAETAINRVEIETGLSIAHYDARFLKPLDEVLLHQIGKKFKKIITIEDGTTEGGFGSAVLEFMADNDYKAEIIRMGIPDSFIEHGTPDELYASIGLSTEGIEKKIYEMIRVEE